MARPVTGLNIWQASLLLRCQQIREARVLAEAARCAAEHATCGQQLQNSQAAAADHAAEVAAAWRRRYDALVGCGSATAAIHALHAREVAARHQQMHLAEVVAIAQERAVQAAARDVAARQTVNEAARQMAQRERLLESAHQDAIRSRAMLDERRSEDAHVSIRAWRA